MRFLKRNHGFTLIELLVVVSIIAILTAVGIVSYSSANKRSRDAKRKSDIEQVRQALEMYRADNGYYPQGTCTTTYADLSCLDSDLVSTYISAVPSDTDTANPYKFKLANGSGSPTQYYGYCLSAYLETEGSVAVEAATCTAYTGYTYTATNP